MALPLNLKRTGEKLLPSSSAITAIENLADVSIITSRKTSQRAVRKFAAAMGATPTAGHLVPGTSLTGARQASGSRDSWWFPTPGLTTGMSGIFCEPAYHCSV